MTTPTNPMPDEARDAARNENIAHEQYHNEPWENPPVEGHFVHLYAQQFASAEVEKSTELIMAQERQEQARLINERDYFKSQLTTLKAVAEGLAKTIRKVWEDDECGYIVGGGKFECCKCGASAMLKIDVPHTEDCSQDYLDKAYGTYTNFINETEKKP